MHDSEENDVERAEVNELIHGANELQAFIPANARHSLLPLVIRRRWLILAGLQGGILQSAICRALLTAAALYLVVWGLAVWLLFWSVFT